MNTKFELDFRTIVIISLLLSNIINILFLLLDPRNPTFGLVTATVLLTGGGFYVITLTLCLRSHKVGFFVNVPLGILASIVVVGDNFELFASTPNQVIYILNWVFSSCKFLLSSLV